MLALGRVDIEIGAAVLGADLARIDLVLLLRRSAGGDFLGLASVAGAQVLGEFRALVDLDPWQRRRRVVGHMSPAHPLLGQPPALGAKAMIGLRHGLGEGRVDHLVAGVGMPLHLAPGHLLFADTRGTDDHVAGGRGLTRGAGTRTLGAFLDDRALGMRLGLEIVRRLRWALGRLALRVFLVVVGLGGHDGTPYGIQGQRLRAAGVSSAEIRPS